MKFNTLKLIFFLGVGVLSSSIYMICENVMLILGIGIVLGVFFRMLANVCQRDDER